MSFDLKMSPTLSERLGRLLVAAALITLPAVWVACAPSSDLVELRLYPCMFGADQPRSVVIEIVGYDAGGELVETHEVAFDNISAGVFDDGFATVGYRADPAVVSADVHLGWSSSPSIGSLDEAETEVTFEMLSVPPAGEVLDLSDGAGSACEPIAGDGDGDPTGDGDGDPTGDGDGDPTGDGDGDGDGDPTGDGDGDMSGDGDGDPSGDGDGDPTGDGDGDPGLPMPGDECELNEYFYCVPKPGGEAGTPLYCDQDTLELELTNEYASTSCGDDENNCPVGASGLVEACAGISGDDYCLCYSDGLELCEGAQLGCDGDVVRLCFEGMVVIGSCPNCAPDGDYFACEGL